MARQRFGALGRRVRRVLQFGRAVLRVDSRRYDQLFTLGWVLFVGVLLAATLGYGERTRLMPLVIGVPTFLMLVALLAVQSSRRIAELVERFSEADTFGFGERMGTVREQLDDPARAESTDVIRARTQILEVFGWVGLLFALVYVTGFLAGTLVYLVATYRIRVGLPWRRTLGYAMAIWASLVLVFVVGLNSRLYPGIVVDLLT